MYEYIKGKYIGINKTDCPEGVYYYKSNDVVSKITIVKQTCQYISHYEYDENFNQRIPIYETYDLYYCLYNSLNPINVNDIVDIYSGVEIETNTIISSKLSDCIYSTPLANGEMPDITYYYASTIQEGEVLFTDKQEDSEYIVSNQDFDLVSNDIAINGTKFDLNNGTIYSKNLSLDRDGNLTIAGKISATSGWIGDENGDGFEIKSRTDNGKLQYYLGNKQISYDGSTLPSGVNRGAAGVYIGPDGIGLGNGNFYVDNKGHLTTQGNVTLGGSITWNTPEGDTFIDGTTIYSPTIYSNEFNVIPEDKKNASGSFNLYSYFADSLCNFLKIYYYAGASPIIHFSSPGHAYAQWDFGNTQFNGTVMFNKDVVVDFSNANVKGIHPKFA